MQKNLFQTCLHGEDYERAAQDPGGVVPDERVGELVVAVGDDVTGVHRRRRVGHRRRHVGHRRRRVAQRRRHVTHRRRRTAGLGTCLKRIKI